LAFAVERIIISDNDVNSVVSEVRSEPSAILEPIDPFDTPSTTVTAMHPSGYGHGV
jgi:Tfp pilus assembly protein PilP